DELLFVDHDANQYSRPVQRNSCGYRNLGCDRIHCDFPGHVHGGHGAHSRNRHTEVDGRLEALHCEYRSARDGLIGFSWHYRRNPLQLGRACLHLAKTAFAESRPEWGLDTASDRDCNCWGHSRSTLSGVQGCPERSNRCARVRIIDPPTPYCWAWRLDDLAFEMSAFRIRRCLVNR